MTLLERFWFEKSTSSCSQRPLKPWSKGFSPNAGFEDIQNTTVIVHLKQLFLKGMESQSLCGWVRVSGTSPQESKV